MVKQKVQVIEHECPPHHFIINSVNVGICKYCPEERDFGQHFRHGDLAMETAARIIRATGKRGRKPKSE